MIGVPPLSIGGKKSIVIEASPAAWVPILDLELRAGIGGGREARGTRTVKTEALLKGP